MRVLDTRGVQEGGPRRSATTPGARSNRIASSSGPQAPDVVVFVAKASEVDAAIDADLDALERVYDEIRRAHRLEPPLVVVVTHCDLLEPKATRLHERGPRDRRGSRGEAAHVTAGRARPRPQARRPRQAAAAARRDRRRSAYMSWRTDGTLRADERWRIDELTSMLFRHLPDASRAELARATQVKRGAGRAGVDARRARRQPCARASGPRRSPARRRDADGAAGRDGRGDRVDWRAARSTSAGPSEFIAGLGVHVGVALALREAAKSSSSSSLPGAGAIVSAAVAFTGTSPSGPPPRPTTSAASPWTTPARCSGGARRERVSRKAAKPPRDAGGRYGAVMHDLRSWRLCGLAAHTTRLQQC